MYWCCKHGKKHGIQLLVLNSDTLYSQIGSTTMSHQIIGEMNIPVFMVVPAFLLFQLSYRSGFPIGKSFWPFQSIQRQNSWTESRQKP
jgi:hypothetical protein